MAKHKNKSKIYTAEINHVCDTGRFTRVFVGTIPALVDSVSDILLEGALKSPDVRDINKIETLKQLRKAYNLSVDLLQHGCRFQNWGVFREANDSEIKKYNDEFSECGQEYDDLRTVSFGVQFY